MPVDEPFPTRQTCAGVPEFAPALTISLGELVEGGFVNWNDAAWRWDAFDEEQRARVNRKIEMRYWLREIGVLPPGAWRRELIRKLNECMPKYKPLYQALKDGADIMSAEGSARERARDIYSDFPATLLNSTNQDYASTGHDREFERTALSDWVDKACDIAERYKDVDVMVLDEVESCFTCLMSVSMSGF